jgi:hypothetical protein
MKNPVLLKEQTNSLIAAARHLLAILAEADRESGALPNNWRLSDLPWAADKRSAMEWTKMWTENISGYLAKLEDALQRKDPSGLRHAASLLSDLARYENDFDYSWFSKYAEFSQTVSSVGRAARPIAASIDTFDSTNMAAARKALD